MDINPPITVLIPCHSTQYLRDSLESIDLQTLDEKLFEVLVIVDRVDHTKVRSILMEFRFHSRVLTSPNPGIVAALNFGLSNTSSELIARMDEDDIMTPKRLEVQKKFLDTNQDYAAVGGQLELIDAANKTIGFSNYPLNLEVNSVRALNQSPLPHPGTMFRKKLVIESGGYRDFLPEDWDLWVRVNEQWKIANIRTTVLKYRVHKKQLSRQETYSSPRGALVVAASQLARKLGLRDHPIESEGVEEWIRGLESDVNFRNGMIQLQLLKDKDHPLKANISFKKTGFSKIVSIFDFLRKDFIRHSPIIYRTSCHRLTIWRSNFK